MPGNRTTAADLVGSGNGLDSGSSSMASSLGHALVTGQVQFKKSKYDMPDNDTTDAARAARHEQAIKKGTQSGKAIFGSPAPHEPKMDYAGKGPQPGFAQIALDFMAKNNAPKQVPDRYELDHKPTTLKKAAKTDNVGGMIDDLMKSLNKD